MSDEPKPVKRSLPITWRSHGAPSDQAVRGQAPIIRPDGRELAVFSQQRQRTCGQCRYFRRKAAQQLMGKFLPQLVHDYGWKVGHLGAKPEDMGRCAQDAEKIVGPNSLGCDQFKVR